MKDITALIPAALRRIAVGAALLAALPGGAVEPPTMGWSSWNTYRVNISDALIRKQAAAMAEKGLGEVGYKYVNIDDGFFGGRDAEGTLFVHPTRFPDGLKPVADYIHSLGFKAGIYSDAGRNTCGNFWDNDAAGQGVGFYEHDQADADLYFRQLGFDFIKIDFCGGDPGQNSEHLDLDERERYTAIRRAIDEVGRKDVRVNVCRWAFPGTWVSQIGSSWRIAADIQPNWNAVARIISENRYLSAYATGGAYNDMDMLEIGRGLSPAEERTHFGMWCMQSSPLLIGCDLTTIPEASLALIKNRDLIALDQDTLGQQARIVRVTDGVYLYVKDLVRHCGTERAVAVYNPTGASARFVVDMKEVELDGEVLVRDLFSGEESTVTGGELAVEVGSHDTRIFRLKGERRLERTVYEAEAAWLERYQELGMNQSLGYANYSDNAACSGGAKVGWLGNHADNWMEWRDVYSQEGGDYDLTVCYIQWEDRFIDLTVGDADPVRVSLPAREPHTNRLAEHTVRVHLEKGFNTVRIGNATGWTPDIDCIRLTRVESDGIGAPVQTAAREGTTKLLRRGQVIIRHTDGDSVDTYDTAGARLAGNR